jgi:polysaccharide export outer membrane protein
VNIFVKEQFGNKVSILGAVNEPGTYDYPSRQNLLDVLAMAGGLSKEAGWMVQVRRSTDELKLPAKFLIDLNQLIKEGKVELNLPIEGDDVIYVPEAGVIYVDGAVRRPGNYPIKGGMTIKEAVVAAGGYSDMADKNHIKLVRLAEEHRREVIELSQEDIRNGTAANLEVKDRDVLFVETSTMRALMYGLRVNIAGGLFGIGYDPRYSYR